MTIRLQPVVVLMLAATASAQPPLPDPPAAETAWSMQVSSTGGITGRGRGTVTVTSSGDVSCAPIACPTPVSAARIKLLTSTIARVADAAWVSQTPSTICNDCMQTTITLKRRFKDGIRTFVAAWDDSQAVPPELRELQRLVFDLRTNAASR